MWKSFQREFGRLSFQCLAMEVKALWAEMLTALLQHNNRKARVKDGQLYTSKCFAHLLSELYQLFGE